MASQIPIHTYHCICSQLVLASAQTLSSLPQRRAGEGLDNALILPLPPLPKASDETPAAASGYSLLLNTNVDKKPVVVRRTDGFETRYRVKCGRCKLVVGYHLDGAQFEGEEEGRNDKVVYLMPGGLV